ncbi:hypothetical protein MRX96_009307 [Rhipicephalus microplus]
MSVLLLYAMLRQIKPCSSLYCTAWRMSFAAGETREALQETAYRALRVGVRSHFLGEEASIAPRAMMQSTAALSAGRSTATRRRRGRSAAAVIKFAP